MYILAAVSDQQSPDDARLTLRKLIARELITPPVSTRYQESITPIVLPGGRLLESRFHEHPHDPEMVAWCVKVDGRVIGSAITQAEILNAHRLTPAGIEAVDVVGKKEGHPPVQNPIAKAIGLKSQNPGWSDRKIAKEAGCNPSRLTRSPQYRRVRAVFDAAPALPRGYKSADGVLDAEAG